MIKVGIYVPAEFDSQLRKHLLRLLLRHPDVDLCCVACPDAVGTPVAELHPVYTGETALCLERTPVLDGLDVLFVIDECNLADEMTAHLQNNPEFRLIVLGDAPQLRRGAEPFVYGFAEYNRKALVRGARAAVSPSPLALLMETALFPLAKNWLLPDADIDAVVAFPSDPGNGAEEAASLLSEVQSSFKSCIKPVFTGAAPYGRTDVTLRLPLDLTVDYVKEIYGTAYEDHGFVYVVPGRQGVDEDLRGSNKCLIQIYCENGMLCINATADFLTRGNAGNAVHLMNLLFGLQERTGLSI